MLCILYGTFAEIGSDSVRPSRSSEQIEHSFWRVAELRILPSLFCLEGSPVCTQAPCRSMYCFVNIMTVLFFKLARVLLIIVLVASGVNVQGMQPICFVQEAAGGTRLRR